MADEEKSGVADPVEEALAMAEDGERDPVREHLAREVVRLREVMEEKDAEIWSLNRELGALEQQVEDEGARGETLGSRISELLAGAMRRVGLGGKTQPHDDDEDDANGAAFDAYLQREPLIPFGRLNAGKKIIAVTAFDLSREDMKKVLKTVERHCAKRDAAPVFLTDSVWSEDFREAGFAFEYFPSVAVREEFAEGLDWPLYLKRRVRIFRRKWDPAGFISFGTRIPVD
ncbi:MAG: hypothetical protein H8E94_08895 [Alphaproteobacteria bacterium]|nr:hypothetical protein [Alphaproteobacteria bacterium]